MCNKLLKRVFRAALNRGILKKSEKKVVYVLETRLPTKLLRKAFEIYLYKNSFSKFYRPAAEDEIIWKLVKAAVYKQKIFLSVLKILKRFCYQ